MTVCMAPLPVVFDLDGTLIDSAPDIHACANAVLRENGARMLSLPQVRSFMGGGVEMLWQKIIHALDLAPARHRDLVAAFMARYHDTTRLTRLLPGAAEALGLLADRGHPLGICTNKPLLPTESILDHFGIRQLFGVVVAGDTQPQKKPDPAPLRAAFQALGSDPQTPEGVFVGDSEFDAACAQALPIRFLIYSHGYRKTPLENLSWHAKFDEFVELPGLVEACSMARP